MSHNGMRCSRVSLGWGLQVSSLLTMPSFGLGAGLLHLNFLPKYLKSDGNAGTADEKLFNQAIAVYLNV